MASRLRCDSLERSTRRHTEFVLALSLVVFGCDARAKVDPARSTPTAREDSDEGDPQAATSPAAASPAPQASVADATEAPLPPGSTSLHPSHGPITVATPREALDFETIAKSAVRSAGGVVTSVEIDATRVGVEVLEKGGNAVDAAVATGFALAVVHQSAASLGGGGFLLARTGASVTSYDFREQSPLGLSPDTFRTALLAGARGPHAVGVPGYVAGLLLAHAHHGRLARKEVLAGAIRLAKSGFVLSPHQARALRLADQEFRSDPTAKRVFYEALDKKSAETRIVNPALARLLVAIAEGGPSAFYGGAAAQNLETVTKGALTKKDLSSYSALEREPLRTEFAGMLVHTMGPPSGGGVVLSEALRLLAPHEGAHKGPLKAANYHLIAEALGRAHVDRRFSVRDPSSYSRGDYEKALGAFLAPSRHAKAPIALDRHTPSAALDPRFEKAASESEQTTHISVIDAEGAAVSLTVTLSSSLGARMMSPDGFVLNNAVLSFSFLGDNPPVPGRRTVSSMSPTIALHPSGLLLVLGSPGGDTIPGTILQTLLHLVHGSSLRAAVFAPRLHQDFVPDVLFLEGKFPKDVARDLEKMGHVTRQRGLIGDANNAAFRGGESVAVADYREGGLALGAKPRKEKPNHDEP